MDPKKSRMTLSTMVGLLLVVLLLALLAAIGFASQREQNKANACINNLRLILSAEYNWAMEQRKQKTDVPAFSEIQMYVGRGPAEPFPVCPDDPKHSFETSYSLHGYGTLPTCKINPSKHILPSPGITN